MLKNNLFLKKMGRLRGTNSLTGINPGKISTNISGFE